MRILHRSLIIDNLIIDERTYGRYIKSRQRSKDEYLSLSDEILCVIFFGAKNVIGKTVEDNYLVTPDWEKYIAYCTCSELLALEAGNSNLSSTADIIIVDNAC